MLKLIAALFWFVLSIANVYFMGANGFLFILSLPYAIFGMLFIFAIIKDFLQVKKDMTWKFDD